MGGVASTPNVTPMVDVMLVLLIIFMVVAPALLAGFNADPPQAQNIKDHPEDDKTDQVLGHRQGWELLPEQEADQGRRRRGRAQAHLRRYAARRLHHVLQGRQGPGLQQGSRCDGHRDEERRARRRHDQRPEAGHDLDGGGRHEATMPVGPRRRRRHREERNNGYVQVVVAAGLSNDINVTPMIDVLLVLLIIFMAVLPSMRKAIDIQLPDPNPTVAPANANSNQIVLEVSPGGKFAINSEAADARIVCRRGSKEIYDPRPEKIIFVKGAPDVKYADVIFAMDVARGAGVKVIGIPPKDTPGGAAAPAKK